MISMVSSIPETDAGASGNFVRRQRVFPNGSFRPFPAGAYFNTAAGKKPEEAVSLRPEAGKRKKSDFRLRIGEQSAILASDQF